MGPEKKSKVMSARAKRLTAYHEGGHAVVAEFLEHTDPVHYITIIPRGPSGGAPISAPRRTWRTSTPTPSSLRTSWCPWAAA